MCVFRAMIESACQMRSPSLYWREAVYTPTAMPKMMERIVASKRSWAETQMR